MKKWLIIGSAVVIVIIIILIAVSSGLGPLVKTAINTFGPKITKTNVSVEDVSVSLFSGAVTIDNFILGNPPGFTSQHAIQAGSIYLDLDEGSLVSDTVIVHKIEMISPVITFEKKGGTDNIKSILANTKSHKKSATNKEDKKLLIKHFFITDGTINLSMSSLGGKGVSAPLPDIHLKDIGKEKGGASPAEVFAEIFRALYSSITSPDVTGILNTGLRKLGAGIDKAGDGTIKGVKSVTNKVKGLFGE